MRILSYAAGAAFTLGMVLAAPAGAAVVYDEGASGDLSDSGLTPTALDFNLGDNDVLGTSGAGDAGPDRDYFTFTVDTGQALTAVFVLPGTTSLQNVSFIGLQAGSQLTVPPDTQTAAGLLGWRHYSPADIGSDILDDIGNGAGAIGFTSPLGPGAYSIWIQEANVGTSSYAFRFRLAEAGTPVPEPTAWPLMLTGLALLGLGLRKKGGQAA